MKLSIDDIKKVAKLARIEFSEDELQQFTTQLDSIIGYIEKMNELDTGAISPTSHVVDVKNVMREDEVRESLPREESIKNAPLAEEGFFKVPKIIE